MTKTIAGTGERGYRGDGGPAVDAALNMPHELRFDSQGQLYVAERDNHVIRKINFKTGLISTVAGTGVAGFSGDGGLATKAQLRQPHSIVFDRDLRRHRPAGAHGGRRSRQRHAVERPSHVGIGAQW